uniref:Uncharacterized protein n=1 Tax=Podarcis muralis TaxID=64176 RepID=A0A670I4G6_PODMU
MGMLGQSMKKMKMASKLDMVQNKQNLIIPEQRSLNLFTMNPPRNVPPPRLEPRGTPRTGCSPQALLRLGRATRSSCATAQRAGASG